ncbi:MAG: thioredoxin family protein [Candidatus Aenigmatarchaeota archaeon]
MKIEILGSGCPKCKELENRVKNVLSKTGIKSSISKITDVNKIIDYGVLSTPALVINGKVVSSGRIPTTEEIEKWVKNNL